MQTLFYRFVGHYQDEIDLNDFYIFDLFHIIKFLVHFRQYLNLSLND